MSVAVVQYPNANLANIISGTVFNLPAHSPINMTVNWNAPDASPKTMYVPPPSLMAPNGRLVISDKLGNCGTWNIIISCFGGLGTIDNLPSKTLNINNQSITLINDGAGNYVIT